GTGHLPDINVARPLFHNGRLIGFAASTAHAPDIGGRNTSVVMADVFEEGFQIPPLKLLDNGKPNEVLLKILGANVRAPDAVVGDLWAQVSGLDVIERRVRSLLEEYEQDDFAELGQEIFVRSEAAMRAAIAEIPHGTYRHSVTPDGHGHPLTIQ